MAFEKLPSRSYRDDARRISEAVEDQQRVLNRLLAVLGTQHSLSSTDMKAIRAGADRLGRQMEDLARVTAAFMQSADQLG